MFYVYALTDPRKDNEIFYIGKGHGHRATNHLTVSANRECNSKQSAIKAIRADGLEPGIVYLLEDLTEELAFLKEKELIAQYGRKDLGKGPLRNLTDGGEGTSGHKHTEETKEKMRKADRSKYNRVAPVAEETKKKLRQTHIGQHSNKGYRYTQEQKDALSLARQGQKCPTTGKKRIYREDGSFYFAKPEN
jgi:hypothetical protein